MFTKVHSRTTRRFRTSALGCAVPMTWSMGRPRVVLWRGSAGGPAVHDRPAFPVTTTPDSVSDPNRGFQTSSPSGIYDGPCSHGATTPRVLRQCDLHRNTPVVCV